MSTQRVTRAASSVSRSVGPTGTPGTPAPKRTSRRAGNQALPAVAAGRSTAYGDNTIAAPARKDNPYATKDDVAEVLKRLTNQPTPGRSDGPAPAKENPVPASASLSRAKPASSAVSPPRLIYSSESNLFANIHGLTSSVAGSSDLSLIPDATQTRLDQDAVETQRVATARLADASAQLGVNPQRRNAVRSVKRNLNSAWQWLQDIVDIIGSWLPSLAKLLLLLLSFYIFFCIIQSMRSSGNSNGVATYGNKTIFESIGQRLNKLEEDVRGINNYIKLDSATVKKLNDTIPDQLIFKKDKDGKVIFPEEFWEALLEEMKPVNSPSEPTDSPESIYQSEKKKETFIEYYQRYWSGNKNKLDAYTMKDVKDIFPHLLEENHIIGKQEIIEAIQMKWIEHKNDISKDMEILKKQMSVAKDNVKSSKPGLSKEELSAAVAEQVYNLIPKAQIDALAKATADKPLSGPRQVDHLSYGTGAVVHSRHTTPTYIFPENQIWLPGRIRRSLLHNPVPVPNGPMMALMPWSEFGDSWCAPSPDKGGLPTSITVIIQHEIYPSHIIVEHLLTGSLEPGSTPKDMELLVYIPDPQHYKDVHALSLATFPESETKSIPQGYIRIGEWRYNVHSPQESQRFAVALDLEAMRVPVKRVMVRALGNWGKGEVPFVCFYRLGLNGELVDKKSMVVDEE